MPGGEEGLAILEEVGDGAAHRRRREQEAPVLLLKPASTGQFYKGHHCSSRRHPGMIFNLDSVENFSQSALQKFSDRDNLWNKMRNR